MDIGHTAVALAQDLLRCRSVTPHDAGVLDVLIARLEPLGFACERITFEAEETPPVDNLVALKHGSGRHLAFAGHTDVVPTGPVEAWSQDPFGGAIVDGWLYGRGAVDMKGAVAAFVAALEAWLPAAPPDAAVSLFITNDEEGPAINGIRKLVPWLQTRGIRPESCLIGEPTSEAALGDVVKIGRRGSYNAHLSVIGHQGHVAYPDKAENPLDRLVPMLHALQTAALDEGTDRFQPSKLTVTSVDVGNPAHNVVPGRAEARINVRFNDQHQGSDIDAWLRARLDEVSEDYDLTTRLSGEAFSFPPEALAQAAGEAIRAVTGKETVFGTGGGTSDARFLKDLCPCAELGLRNDLAHKIDEKVSLQDLTDLTEIYRQCLERYFRT